MLNFIKRISQEISAARERVRFEKEQRKLGRIPTEIEFRIYLKNGEMLGPIIFTCYSTETEMFFISAEERAESLRQRLLEKWGSSGIEYEGFFYPHSMIERIEPRPIRKVQDDDENDS